MAAERAALVELLTSVKAALKRRGDESESEEPIVAPSNRGRKLKRQARFTHEGQLDAPTGPRVYKEEVEYGGARRYIIHRHKRPRREEDDEEEEEEDSNDEAGPALDPFDGVDIEQLLTPVNNPADLPSHPTLSAPYTSKILDQLCQEALNTLSTEHQHTIAIKNLLTTFLGDDEFACLEKMETLETPAFIKEAQVAQAAAKQRKSKTAQTAATSATNGIPNGSQQKSDGQPAKSTLEGQGKDAEQMEVDAAEDNANPTNPPPPTRMTTRSLNQQQQQQQTQSETQETASIPSPRVDIDAFFFPPSYKLDKDFGIPAHEAEETRRLLLACSQRQEEFMRGLKKVHQGLLQARHRKKNVWSWCRAMEGVRNYQANKLGKHPSEVTEEEMEQGLSDNEDWFDREEWGLEQDLVKGKEEEEEEEKTKKTRGRR